MFRSTLLSATIPAGMKRLLAGPPRRANDINKDRWVRIRRANTPRRAPFGGTLLCQRISRLLQAPRGVSKNASRKHRGFEWSEIEQRARGGAAGFTRPHCASSPLPGLPLLDRTARSVGAGEIRASDVPAAVGFLGCEPGSLLATCGCV